MDLSIPQRFNGPLESGNGGYSSGILARRIDGPAEVSLRSPVPLDTRLEIAEDEDGSPQLPPTQSTSSWPGQSKPTAASATPAPPSSAPTAMS
ncbi:MAG: hypothetical protein QOF13_1107 [Solirubrobacterales bacterium]|jgi:hypothetical protein|nr:hypothetical protein [Solirubrobacterales bacterium]